MKKSVYAPSFYRMTNYDFIKKISEFTKKRTKLKCKFKSAPQPEYKEPLKKINYDKVYYSDFNLNSKQVWSEFIEYYLDI